MKLVGQIIGFIAIGVSLISFHKKTKENILKGQILSHILSIVHYFLIDAYSGSITKCIALVRDNILVISEKGKKKANNIYLCFFVLLYSVLIYFTFQKSGLLSIFSYIAALFYTVMIWNADSGKIKYVAFCTHFLY